jgi:hypothetical protein
MSFAAFLNTIRPELPAWADAADYGVFLPHGEVGDLSAVPPPVRALADRYVGLSPTYASYAEAISQLARFGPKVFTFDALTCEALENFTLSVPATDYHQPFAQVVIQLPDDYAASRVVPHAKGDAVPDFLIVERFDLASGGVPGGVPDGVAKGCMVLLLIQMDTGMFTGHLLILNEDKTLDEVVTDTSAGLEEHVGAGVINLRRALMRLALNINLMATCYGVRKLGFLNPSYCARLSKRLAKNHRPELHTQNEAELRAAPVLYTFDQQVTLFQRQNSGQNGTPPPPTGPGTGARKSPHWRRGHWRSQPFGAGRTQRKLVMIPSVLVNADLFLGKPGDTSATYHVR